MSDIEEIQPESTREDALLADISHLVNFATGQASPHTHGAAPEDEFPETEDENAEK